MKAPFAQWFARMAVGLVFAVNVSCAAAFILWPQNYAAGFEVSGVPGLTLVRGMGLLFLMWNATYPLVLWQPGAHRALFAVILAQQLMGVLGETWLWLALPPGHAALSATGLRFILFDGLGLLLMGLAFWFLHRAR